MSLLAPSTLCKVFASGSVFGITDLRSCVTAHSASFLTVFIHLFRSRAHPLTHSFSALFITPLVLAYWCVILASISTVSLCPFIIFAISVISLLPTGGHRFSVTNGLWSYSTIAEITSFATALLHVLIISNARIATSSTLHFFTLSILIIIQTNISNFSARA